MGAGGEGGSHEREPRRQPTRQGHGPRPGGDEPRCLRHRQRLHRAERGDPRDRIRSRDEPQPIPVGHQRVRGRVRCPHRHRWTSRRPVRSPAGLHDRCVGVRRVLPLGWIGPRHRAADRLPGGDGHRRGDDVACHSRHDLRHPARGAGQPGRWPHPRRRRAGQRRGPAARRRAHRRPQLAVGVLPQRAHCRLRDVRHRPQRP
jgi:hypothetical protein